MTAIRKSYRIAIEDGFGTGVPLNGKWYQVPQGFYLSWSGSTQAQSLYGTGAKLRQNSIYGAFQGSWNASFVMDFEHLEFFSMIFDVVDGDTGVNTTVPGVTGPNSATVYAHTFKKINNKRQRSYVIQEMVLNKIANGDYDEKNTLKGVLARNLQLARSTSGSQMAAEMSGVFADKFTELFSEAQNTFFTATSASLTQYSCMYMGTTAVPTDEDAIEQVDSHSIQLETAVSLVYSTCSPIATDFFEDKSTFSWNATAYMNNPTKKFKLLSNSGGTLDPKVTNQTAPGKTLLSPDGHHALQPMGKNLRPLEHVNFITYSESKRDQYGTLYNSIVGAYEASANSITVHAQNSTVKSTSTPKGDGSKLQDSLSSVECDAIEIIIRNTKATIWSDEDLNGTPEAGTQASFTQAAVSGKSTAVTFTLPVSGYDGAVIGYADITQSESSLSDVIVMGPGTDYTDLSGFTIINDPTLQSTAVGGVQYRLDNLVPKQLTAAGTAGPSGLTVENSLVSSVATPKISGTPRVARTDYYFIVKDNGATATPRYTTGYLRVTVR